MLTQRINNVGIDVVIDRLQTELNDEFSALFTSWESYPRVYLNTRIKDDNEYKVFEHCTDSKNYKELSFSDKVDLLTFFIKDEEITIENQYAVSNVSFIVACNLNKLELQTEERADEELKRLLYMFFMRFESQRINLIKISEGVENVFREVRNENLIWSNIAPRHVVRFDFKIMYEYKCKC